MPSRCTVNNELKTLWLTVSSSLGGCAGKSSLQSVVMVPSTEVLSKLLLKMLQAYATAEVLSLRKRS